MNRKYILNSKMKKLIKELSGLTLKNIKGKFILCGIYSGGVILGEELVKEFKRKKIKSNLYYIRLNKTKEYTVMKTNLPKNLNDTMVIFLDDAIWTGRTKFAVEKHMNKNFRGVKYKFATLLDCGGYSDFSVY